MSLLRVFGFSVFALSIVVLPFATEAQTTTYGTLNVFVRMAGPQNPGGLNPWDFRATVTGAEPSISSFAGSSNGTVVQIKANTHFKVSINTKAGYVPEYSGVCDGSVAEGETQDCYITQVAQPLAPVLPPAPIVYQYPGQFEPFACTPANQTVAFGTPAVFEARGGSGQNYTWSTSERTYVGVGSRISHLFLTTGEHAVTVSNGNNVATCRVTVGGNVVATPSTLAPTPIPSVSISSPPVNVTGTYIPNALPNTGFDPAQASAIMAFLVVLTLGGGFTLLPYARKVVTAIR